MRAAVLHRIGDPPVAGEFDAPTAKAGEIVVEVELAALNPVDLTIAGGRFYAAIPEVPSVVGREGLARLDGGGLA